MSAEQMLAFDLPAYFGRLGLLDQLSQSRSSGLKALLDEIRAIAGQYHD
jgi:cysteine desulfuration protein SufE